MDSSVRKRMALLALAAALIVVAVMVAGCAKKETPAPTGEPYKIGAIFAVTGDASPLGEPEKETAELLEEHLNKQGGINGHKVEIIVLDTAGEELKTVLAAKQLVESHNVIAVVGPSRSGTTLAIVKYMEDKKVPLISCAASVKIVEPADQRQWIFKTPQSDRHAIQRIGDFLKEKDVSKVAFINVSNAFGDSGLAQAEVELPKMDIEIVVKEKFGPEETDMTPQLTRIKATDAQALICWGTNPGPSRLMKNARQLGLKMHLIQSHGIANKKFIELAEGAADGVIFPAGRLIVLDQLPETHPQYDVLKEYTDLYTAKYEKAPNTFGGHAWDAITLLADALENVGDDRAKIRDYIETRTDFVGTGGVFNFSAADHNGLDPDAFVMVEIEDGEWVRL